MIYQPVNITSKNTVLEPHNLAAFLNVAERRRVSFPRIPYPLSITTIPYTYRLPIISNDIFYNFIFEKT